MKPTKLLFAITMAFATVCGFAQESISNNKGLHCHIEGEVVDSTFTRILLIIGDGDPRVVPVDTILVKDGHFSHDIYIDEPEFYQLFACEDYDNGCWMALDFFAEEGDVYATFYGYAIDEAPHPTLHSQTPLNKELLAYKRSIEERFYIPMRLVKEDLEKGEELRKEMYEYELDYITNNPNLVGLYLLNQATQRLYNKDDAAKQPYVDVFKRLYDAKYPTNNMAINLRNWVSSLDMRVGSRIIDFTLPDLNGVKHTLSKEIEGKIAVVDFWASWCGPCRRTSMSFIPLYNKYKDKGFTIVGVASELESEDMRLAVEKDGYPWLNLLALRGVENIWERYGIRGAGEVFLVDRDGTIIAIGATAEEVEQILKERL